MIKEKINLIELYMRKKINKDNLIQEYTKKFGIIDICHELDLSIEKKDSEFLDCILYLGDVIKYKYVCIYLLEKLILEKWHYKHEDLARLLQAYKSPSSVDVLYLASNLNLEYLDFDDNYSLAIKCIRGINSIGNENAIEKLKILSKSKNEKIKNNAILLLNENHKKK
ncbi:TPA: hypothetical protein U2J86_005162 [Serratia marcescens]|uniref:hypothetical protein n=1 Tax=Proteus genomosp. 4 TaxID=1311818 RepID=UPI000D695273|nr:hypothetical protein [Proteus genomosp. 4]HEM7578103.1 hypothetical protein [Serratia marcescens]